MGKTDADTRWLRLHTEHNCGDVVLVGRLREVIQRLNGCIRLPSLLHRFREPVAPHRVIAPNPELPQQLILPEPHRTLRGR